MTEHGLRKIEAARRNVATAVMRNATAKLHIGCPPSRGGLAIPPAGGSNPRSRAAPSQQSPISLELTAKRPETGQNASRIHATAQRGQALDCVAEEISAYWVFSDEAQFAQGQLVEFRPCCTTIAPCHELRMIIRMSQVPHAQIGA